MIHGLQVYYHFSNIMDKKSWKAFLLGTPSDAA